MNLNGRNPITGKKFKKSTVAQPSRHHTNGTLFRKISSTITQNPALAGAEEAIVGVTRSTEQSIAKVTRRPSNRLTRTTAAFIPQLVPLNCTCAHARARVCVCVARASSVQSVGRRCNCESEAMFLLCKSYRARGVESFSLPALALTSFSGRVLNSHRVKRDFGGREEGVCYSMPSTLAGDKMLNIAGFVGSYPRLAAGAAKAGAGLSRRVRETLCGGV